MHAHTIRARNKANIVYGGVSLACTHTLSGQGTRLILCVVECHLHAHTHYQDTVIYERLLPNEPFSKMTEKHLEYFAYDGLRTLCVAEATIDEADYQVPPSSPRCFITANLSNNGRFAFQ